MKKNYKCIRSFTSYTNDVNYNYGQRITENDYINFAIEGHEEEQNFFIYEPIEESILEDLVDSTLDFGMGVAIESIFNNDNSSNTDISNDNGGSEGFGGGESAGGGAGSSLGDW